MLALFKSIVPVRALPAAAQFSSAAVVLSELKEKKPRATTKQTKKKSEKTKKPATVYPLKPTAVKKAAQPFFFYVRERYANDKDMIMELEFSKRSAFLRDQWNVMSPAEQAPFVSAYETDKQRYAAEVEQAKKDGPPKRPLSAYLKWFNENRVQLKNQNPGITFQELGKLGGEKWRELSDLVKDEYKASSAEETANWKVEYAKWKDALPKQ